MCKAKAQYTPITGPRWGAVCTAVPQPHTRPHQRLVAIPAPSALLSTLALWVPPGPGARACPQPPLGSSLPRSSDSINLFSLLAKTLEWEKQCQKLKINSRNFQLKGLLCNEGMVRLRGLTAFHWCVSNRPPVWAGGRGILTLSRIYLKSHLLHPKIQVNSFLWLHTCLSLSLFFLSLPKDMLIEFRERAREGERGKKHQSVASHMCPMGD